MAEADSIRCCVECGAALPTQSRASGARRKTCSQKCRSAIAQRNKKSRAAQPPEERATCAIDGCDGLPAGRGWCAKHYSRFRQHGDPLFSLRGYRVNLPCERCGQVMRLRPSIAKITRFCSRACAQPKQERPCLACGSRIKRSRGAKPNGNDRGVYCSRDCASTARGRVQSEGRALGRIAENWRQPSQVMHPAVAREVEAIQRIARRPVVARLTWRLCSGGCGHIMPGYMGRSRTCSECRAAAVRATANRLKRTPHGKARRREDKARRRAAERGVRADRIDPFKVFERDGWRCYLCGCHTPRELRGTYEPNAPELEHVLPLAMGGEHTWANVRCACRKCNLAKGASTVFLTAAA